MHNNDPRVVDQTKPVAKLSFDEAAELAYFGAKILHPQSIRPAAQLGIPVKLLNTLDPSARGTTISNETGNGFVKAIAAKDGITAIKIKSARMLLAYGFLRSVFEVFERFKTPIDMITTSEVAVSLTIDDTSNLDKIIKELESFGIVEIDTDQSIVCIVGNMVSETEGAAIKIFESLKNVPVRMISYGGSRHNISVVVEAKNKQRIVLMTTKGSINYTKFKFKSDDTILFGRESAGVPEKVHKIIKNRLKIPMNNQVRSLNIASSVAIVLAESLRQIELI